MGSGIIHILAIEGHDVIKHPLSLDSRTVRVKRNSLDIAVDGLVPFRLFPKGVTLCAVIYNTLFCLQRGYSSSANRWSSDLPHQERG